MAHQRTNLCHCLPGKITPSQGHFSLPSFLSFYLPPFTPLSFLLPLLLSPLSSITFLFPSSPFFPPSLPPLFPQVSVMHSVQAGYTDKALSYADKAMQFIDQQKGSCDHFNLHL